MWQGWKLIQLVMFDYHIDLQNNYLKPKVVLNVKIFNSFHNYNSSLNTDRLGILVVYFIVFKWILKACLFRAKNPTTTPGNPCLPASPYVPYTHKPSCSNTCITNVNTILDQVFSQMSTHQRLLSVKRLFLHLLLSSFEHCLLFLHLNFTVVTA